MAASTYAAPAAAQVDGSVGVGAGTVRYPGGTSSGSAILSPSARYTSAALVAAVSSSTASPRGLTWPPVALCVGPTRFREGWFTEASAGVTRERGGAVGSSSALARLAATYASTVAGSAYLQVFLKPRVALELGGGSSLGEPY